MNVGHVKIGMCAGLVYLGSSIVVPRLMPNSALARVFRSDELFMTVGMKTVACAALGSLLATSVFGARVEPPPGGLFGMTL